ncbi:MAG: tetratricopeptide repeat protein [Fluviicola sp.]|nr:tetratricopeptide repeat protein [Fluviicola sp.]
MKVILSIVALLFSLQLLAQTSTDQQLANLYYTNGEFDKALPYFEKIINKQSTKFEYFRYVECLEKTGNTKEAEKILKKLAGNATTDYEYTIALSDFYERTNQLDKSQKISNDLIKSVSKSGFQTIELYNALLRKGKVEWALKTLQAARKELKNQYPLHLQFAEVYSLLGKTDEMIDELMEVLDNYPGSATDIQASLSQQIDFQEDATGAYVKLKGKLLTRIQKKPNEVVYADMLIWLFVQKKEFKSALVQAQALDIRENGGGKRLMILAETCVQNTDFPTARQTYNSVIALGSNAPYYFQAYNALLNVRYREITQYKNTQAAEIAQAISEYRSAIQVIGWNRNAVGIAKELAIIQAYYGNDAKSAGQLLDSCLSLPGLNDIGRAEIKMALADVLVLQDDIWQASLYYMQIDKDFKFEPIGAEAKFKNARIFYYDGDFKFAQSQLDILKESTSKLIANDAMKLSILITDNLGLDSNYTAMNLFAKADLLLEQHQFQAAFELYDSIIRAFPDHGLNDELLLRKASAMMYQGEWKAAEGYLLKIYTSFGQDILADDAVFQLAELYENQLSDKEKAAEYYKKILLEFKGSLLTIEARKRFRLLRGDAIDSDL